MPNDALTDAIKEAYATAPTGAVYLDTLELNHPDVTPSIYLVKDRANRSLTLEGGGGTKTFRACYFRMTQPTSGEARVQELTIALDNVDRAIGDFIEVVKESLVAVQVTYRPYLLSDPSQPQMNPPLVLYLRDVVVTALEVTGKATFADILNKRYLTELYTRARFPSLAN